MDYLRQMRNVLSSRLAPKGKSYASSPISESSSQSLSCTNLSSRRKPSVLGRTHLPANSSGRGHYQSLMHCMDVLDLLMRTIFLMLPKELLPKPLPLGGILQFIMHDNDDAASLTDEDGAAVTNRASNESSSSSACPVSVSSREGILSSIDMRRAICNASRSFSSWCCCIPPRCFFLFK